MKTFRFLISAALLSSVFIFTACEKADPCLGVICENDGICIDGSCECDLYHTGENCEEVRFPRSIHAQKVDLDYLTICNSWDGNTGPIRDADVYIQVLEDGKIIYDTKYLFITDTSCDGGCLFDRPITLKPEFQYQLRVFDYDSWGDDDLILVEYFTPMDYLEDDYYEKTWKLEVLNSRQECSIGNFAMGGWMSLKLIDVHYNM